MLVSPEKGATIGKRLSSLSEKLVSRGLRNQIKKSRLNIKAVNYINASIINSLLYTLLFSALFSLLFFSESGEIAAIIKGISMGILLGLLFFVILYFYPTLIAKKIGNSINSELLYILNDILVQVKAKVELYQAFINVVSSNPSSYASGELQKVIDDVESGTSMYDALKNLALQTNSSFMKRTAWQLMNSIKSGSDPVLVIESLINELENYYYALINTYIKELNVLTLIYLTIAIVAPTIGITVLIILSSFGGLSLNSENMSIIISGLLLVQPVVIGFIKSRRPFVKI